MERHKQRLEELSITLLQRLDTLLTLHDSFTPGFNDRFNDTVNTLKNTAKGEEEARELVHLLDSRDGTHTPLDMPFWSDCVPGERGHGVNGGHFKARNQVAWVNVRSGEVWTRVWQPHNDPDLNVIQDNYDAYNLMTTTFSLLSSLPPFLSLSLSSSLLGSLSSFLLFSLAYHHPLLPLLPMVLLLLPPPHHYTSFPPSFTDGKSYTYHT